MTKPTLHGKTIEAGKIVISDFCQSRDQESCSIPLNDLIPALQINFSQARSGYRDGVIYVPLNPLTFKGRIVNLLPGDKLEGLFTPRTEGEAPRKQIKADTKLTPAPLRAVDAVLYHKSVLAENNENSDPTANWEVIAILTKISEEDQPLPPETLMANHFQTSGGTATNMSPEQFEKAMKKSYLFWKDRAILP